MIFSIQDYFFDRQLLTDGAPPNDRGCRACGKIGHIVAECPRSRQKKTAENRKREQEKEKPREPERPREPEKQPSEGKEFTTPWKICNVKIVLISRKTDGLNSRC